MIKVHWLAQAFFAAFLAMSVAACTASSPTSESAGQYVDSAAITTKVKAALAKDPQVSAMQVNVETFKDVVQLSGFVNTPTAKRSEEHTYELQSLMRISYAVFCLKKKTTNKKQYNDIQQL